MVQNLRGLKLHNNDIKSEYTEWGEKPTEQEKKITNCISDKVLISQIYERLIQLNSKKSKLDYKMGRAFELTFFQRRHTNDQQAHEKMLNLINHQGNANQNHNEISPHTSQNGYYQKDNK